MRLPPSTPLVLEKTVGDRGQDHVALPSRQAAAFEVIEPDLVFEFLVLLFDRPPLMGGDVPVMADYDGDRRSDFAVWRPSTGDWWILHSATDVSERRAWGNSSFTAVPADYDGDGRADPAVWRASTGDWWVLLSSTAYTRYVVQAWGDTATIPIGAREP